MEEPPRTTTKEATTEEEATATKEHPMTTTEQGVPSPSATTAEGAFSATAQEGTPLATTAEGAPSATAQDGAPSAAMEESAVSAENGLEAGAEVSLRTRQLMVSPERRRAVIRAMWQKAALTVREQHEKEVTEMLIGARSTAPKKSMFSRFSSSVVKGFGSFAGMLIDEVIAPEAKVNEKSRMSAAEARHQQAQENLREVLLRLRTEKIMRNATDAFKEAGQRRSAKRDGDAERDGRDRVEDTSVTC